ncbi:hypothetical protein BGY98DRAFT_932666 [Russula aff. rugulosa BPL654]|nr:hypothetical protein BGY98DRAFT_932666 [Russula aff. rugulosa BPL654]
MPQKRDGWDLIVITLMLTAFIGRKKAAFPSSGTSGLPQIPLPVASPSPSLPTPQPPPQPPPTPSQLAVTQSLKPQPQFQAQAQVQRHLSYIGEEEMPDEDEAQAEGQFKTPEKTTITLPPSAPKETSAGTVPPAPEIQTMCKSPREIKLSQKARDIQLQDKLSQAVRFPKRRRRNHPAKTPTMGSPTAVLVADGGALMLGLATLECGNGQRDLSCSCLTQRTVSEDSASRVIVFRVDVFTIICIVMVRGNHGTRLNTRTPDRDLGPKSRLRVTAPCNQPFYSFPHFSVPGITRRGTPRDILDSEKRDETSLQAEPYPPGSEWSVLGTISRMVTSAENTMRAVTTRCTRTAAADELGRSSR